MTIGRALPIHELMLICDSSSRTTTVYYMKDRSHTALVCLAKANGSERDTERLEAWIR